MSLPVPLSVRVGDRHITREVKSLSFRREAVGGVRSISFGLARPLSDLNGLDPLAQVYVYDTRSATTVAQGRLADAGRTASADGGQSWDVVAFGPAQHTSDIAGPLIYVDRSLDSWRSHVNYRVGNGATWASGATIDNGTPGLMSTWSDGTAVADGTVDPPYTTMRYPRAQEAGMKLARLYYQHRAGTTTWRVDAVYSTDGSYGASDTGTSDAWTTTGGTRIGVVTTNFANGRNVVDVRTYWTGGAGSVAGDATWCIVAFPAVETVRLDATGAEILTGYDGEPHPHNIVNDLLGRLLPEFDGPNATVDDGSTYAIQQLAYPDGVTAEQVLADLMAFEPAYRWTTTPDTTGDGYGFRWEQWPTTVRYEATLDDGGSFPLSAQGIYNEVAVRWQDEVGLKRMTLRTAACPILDDRGLTRRAQIDLGSEIGSQSAAEAAGDAFLDEHNVPKNAGTLTVARPIRDVITGAMVDPWEIEPGELVRILGVEAYPDAFNASTNDGQGVFRIFAVDYTSEGNVATLALDSDPRETADALVKLLKQRSRR